MKQGKIDTCCGYGMDGKKSNYDCVRIPSATKFAIATKASDQSIKKGSGFCGNRGLVSTTGATLATVCCKHIHIDILIPEFFSLHFFLQSHFSQECNRAHYSVNFKYQFSFF